MEQMYINKSTLVTFQGIGEVGIDSMIKKEPMLKEILRPECLKNKVLKIDPATALCMVAVNNLIESVQSMKQNVGIIVSTRLGNHQIVKQYINKVNVNKKAPGLYAASGYNICVGVPSLVHSIQGPTFIMGGKSKLEETFLVAKHLLKREDVKGLLVGKLDVDPEVKSGICMMFCVSEDKLEEDAFEMTTIEDLFTSLKSYAQEKSLNKNLNYIEESHKDVLDAYLLWEMLEMKKQSNQQIVS